MELTGWIDALPAGPTGVTPRFDPSVRTAGEMAGAGIAWPAAAPEPSPSVAAVHHTAA